MGIGERIKNLWELSKITAPPEEAAPILFRKPEEKAVFIQQNKVEEIFNSGGNLNDAINHE